MVGLDSDNRDNKRESPDNKYEGMSYEVEFVTPRTPESTPEKIVRFAGKVGSVEKLMGIIKKAFPHSSHEELQVAADYDGSMYISGFCENIERRTIVYNDGSEREL